MSLASWRRCWMVLLMAGVAVTPVVAQQGRGLIQPPVLIAVSKDEQPIELRRATIDGEVQAGIAQTRIELVFHNPNRRVMEGELQFPLADGQQISGFALDIDGQLRDAVPVPKERGRQVFEAITRQGQDPALLEQTAGNQFRLRVYPLPAEGSRRVQLTIREAMPLSGAGWQWRLPLQFAAAADEVSLRLRASGADKLGQAPFRLMAGALDWQGSGRQLPAQLQWQLPAKPQPALQSARYDGQQYLLAQLPLATPVARSLPSKIGLLWDASGSAGTRNRAREFALLDRYFAVMGEGSVVLTVLRDKPEAERRFSIRKGDWSGLRRVLEQTPNDGASALASWTPKAELGEYLLLSDGLSNWGASALPALAAGQRLYAINSAAAGADTARLRGWSEANGGSLVQLDSDDVAAAATRLLATPATVEVAPAAGLHDVVIDRRSLEQGWLWLYARTDAAPAELRLRINGGQWQTLNIVPGSTDGGLMAGLWAQARLQQLAVGPRGNREAMQRLSQQFGMVSEGSSLLVLDTLDDYLRYAIRPPAALRAEYDRRFARQVADREAARKTHLDEVAEQWRQRQAWWEKPWPKDAPLNVAQGAELARQRSSGAPVAAMAMAPPPPAPAPAAAAVSAESSALDRVVVTGSSNDAVAEVAAAADGASVNSGAVQIQLAAWEPDSAVAQRLRKAPVAELYAWYLDEREANANSSAFFLDVADILFAAGQRELALRVLSNLAEMELDNRHLLRVLGYRLMQANAPALAVPVFEQVLLMAQDEPQSFRDLGLALAAAGHPQQAIGPLYQVVQRQWDGRFDGVALIALDELTNLLARGGQSLDATQVDPRLRKAMPLDLRVVLAWDADNSDMDLWVTDPDGERAYYGNRLTRQGGQMSQDFTGGYGPEQFSLRDAKPGIYKVEANYFGSRQQLVTGATTLMLRLSTHWGTPQQQDKAVTMRLQDASDTVLVGEFEVR
ncbi:VIT domain-containing protein [Stenotrophomonas sp.]|uniref:VIT domain-containing protein n=1 Tax=Stenotrophomonas sp. TaxID=69392 RepID=UPI0028ACD111|nr:VIT domain-containing protein [Stenotrophomonas sp.]